MKLNFFVNEKDNLKASNNLLKFFIIIIGFMQVVNLIWNFYLVKNTRTIIIPAGIDTKFEVQSNKISEEGLKQYGRYIAFLAFNYSPFNVRSQFEELLKLYDPDSLPGAKTTFYSIAEDVEKANVTSAFYIQKMFAESSKIEILGTKKQYVSDTKLKDETETYIIEYTVKEGKFLIKKIYLKESK